MENNTISDEGQFIFRYSIRNDGFEVEKILNKTEYDAVAKAYLEMED